jgi:hypothetical protein
MTTPVHRSAIGEAMALLNAGQKITPRLFRELTEQGYDPIGLAARTTTK